MKLPLKTRILQYAIVLGNSFTLSDVYEALTPEYQGERLFSRKTVEEYADSFLGISFLKAAEVTFGADGALLIRYQISDYGRSREKYIH